MRLSVFPNPNDGRFKIIIEGSIRPARVFITDINGRVVRKLDIMDGEPAWVSNLLPGSISYPSLMFSEPADRLAKRWSWGNNRLLPVHLNWKHFKNDPL